MLRTLRLGDEGYEVSALRGILGLKDGSTFDTTVEEKIITGQKKYNLTTDGVVGPATWSALAAHAKHIQQGSSGSVVRGLQYLMDGIKPDGKFGAKTKAAVATYQATIGMNKSGKVGSKTWASLLTGSTSVQPSTPSTTPPITPPAPGQFVRPKDFKQAGKPWGPKMYSSTGNKKQTYANSACGPTNAANVVYTARDKTVTPETLGKLSLKWGCRTANSGTAWSFFKKVATEYKFKSFSQTTSMATMKAALDKGWLVIASMGPGYWTKGGHFINPWKYDGTYIYANDSASTTRHKQKTTEFSKQRKQFFIYEP